MGTVEKLKAFGAGVAFIIKSFEHMIVKLEQRGYFEPEGVEGVILFFGMAPDDATICRYELAYTITLNALGCLPDQPAPDLAKWLEPVNRPFPLRNKPREELMGADATLAGQPSSNGSRRRWVPSVSFTPRSSGMWTSRASSRPSIVPRSSRRPRPGVARCHAEVRMAYHRAWRDLVILLDKDEEKGAAEIVGEEDRDRDEGKDEDEVKDYDCDYDGEENGERGVTAVAAREAVVHDEAVAGCAGRVDSLPIDPENRSDPLAQLPEKSWGSIETPASGSEGAKSAPCGVERGKYRCPNPPIRGRSGFVAA